MRSLRTPSTSASITSLAEQQHQPVHRTRETVVVRAPAHRLRDRHRRDRLAHDLRQQVGGLRARLDRAVDETLALVVAGLLQRRPVDAGLGRETLQRLGRLAVGVERDVEVGAEHFGGLLRLLAGDARQQHREAARRVQRFGVVALERDAALHQAVDHAVEERLRQRRQRLDRQFFGAQFDQRGFMRSLRRFVLSLASGRAGLSRCRRSERADEEPRPALPPVVCARTRGRSEHFTAGELLASAAYRRQPRCHAAALRSPGKPSFSRCAT